MQAIKKRATIDQHRRNVRWFCVSNPVVPHSIVNHSFQRKGQASLYGGLKEIPLRSAAIRMALLGWILFFCEFAKITLRILFDQHEKERHGLTCDKVDRMKTRLNRAILSCSPAFWIA